MTTELFAQIFEETDSKWKGDNAFDGLARLNWSIFDGSYLGCYV